jgi:hypothetical protein
MRWVKWHKLRPSAPVELDDWSFSGNRLTPNDITLSLLNDGQHARLIMSPAEARLVAERLIKMVDSVAPQ